MSSVVPFTSLLSSVETEQILSTIEPPTQARIWLSKQYTDLKGWYTLQNPESLMLKPTKFSDARIRFLDPQPASSPPEEFKNVVSGRFDVKTWKKEGPGGPMILSVEGERSVFIKMPNGPKIVSWSAPDRLPVFEKSWRPIIFAMDPYHVVIRLTTDIVLFLVMDKSLSSNVVQENKKSTFQLSDNFTVYPIDYNNGFCCVHPCTGQVIVYGSYSIQGLSKDVYRIPNQLGTLTNWGFYVHFFPWGNLLIPHTINLNMPKLLNKCFDQKVNQFGLIFHPPNMYIPLRLKLPRGVKKSIQYQKDFSVTAIKISSTDIEIYLILDGQLVRNNFSFDLRKTKEGKPLFTQPAIFQAYISLSEKIKISESAKKVASGVGSEPYIPKWTFQKTDDVEVLISIGSPSSDLGHLVSRDTAAVFDAERGISS